MDRIAWIKNDPINTTPARIIYALRREDDECLLLDAVTVEDIEGYADEIMELDALVSPYSRLEIRMRAMLKVMKRAPSTVKPISVTVSNPFKKNGVAQVGALFELSDGQTVTIFFHNPDSKPAQLSPTDEMVSWKWLLNKRDITIVVAPENGKDLKLEEVALRVMKLADKNSKAFARANAKKAERAEKIKEQQTQIEELNQSKERLVRAGEVAKQEYEDSLKDLETAKKAATKRKAAAAARAKAKAEEAARKKAEEEARAEEERKAAEEAAKRAAEEAAKKSGMTPAEEVAEPTKQDSEWETDRQFLQTVIDKTVPDVTAYDVLNRTVQIAKRWSDDAEKLATIEAAVQVEQAKVIENANAAMEETQRD